MSELSQTLIGLANRAEGLKLRVNDQDKKPLAADLRSLQMDLQNLMLLKAAMPVESHLSLAMASIYVAVLAIGIGDTNKYTSSMGTVKTQIENAQQALAK